MNLQTDNGKMKLLFYLNATNSNISKTIKNFFL